MDFKPKPAPMRSGFPSDEQVFRRIQGKSRIWMVGVCEYPATQVFCSGGYNSRGFGGATVNFLLEDGTTESLTGPWNTSADELYKDTSVDVRDTYPTQLFLARDVQYSDEPYGTPTMIDVVHMEPTPVKGTFKRPNLLAQEISNRLGETLYYYIETYGGGQSYRVTPQTQKP